MLPALPLATGSSFLYRTDFKPSSVAGPGLQNCLSVIIKIFQLLPIFYDSSVKNIFPPDVDCIFKTELVVIVSEEVADGRIVPAHNNRMRFCLRGGHFSTFFGKRYFCSNYFRGWTLFVAHLIFHNFRHLIVWLFAADPWDPIFWRGLGVVDCPTQLMCTQVFICSVSWQRTQQGNLKRAGGEVQWPK